jgi:hypothetical protein
MYLLVNKAGKYWRMNYRINGDQQTLAIGVYPAISLAQARKIRDEDREMIAAGLDPNVEKKAVKLAKLAASENTFKAIPEAFLVGVDPEDGQFGTRSALEMWLRFDSEVT